MKSATLKHEGQPDRIGVGEGGGGSPCLDIEFDESRGLVRIYDPRLFRAGRIDFCERLLEAACRRPGIYKIEVDLASASCQIEFCLGSNAPGSMAESFVGAVREAAAGTSWLDRISGWGCRPRWSTLTAFRLPDGVALWKSVAVEPARIQLRRPGVAGDRARLAHLADRLAGLEGVEACHVSPWFHRITIDVCRDIPLSERFLDDVEQRIKAADWSTPEALAPDADVERAVAIATGWKRLTYLAMAGGSFALTLVALAVPGIPTVPCLLATSYYLARSSPRLDARLRRTIFFGPILREWEHDGGLSRSSKSKLTLLTIAIVIVTVALTPLTPATLIVIVLVSSLSIYGIARMPELPDGPDEWPKLEGRAILALPPP